MKIKIQKRAEQFNIRKRYKKGDVVVIKGDRPIIATVIKMVANGVVETTSHAKIAAQALRPATSIEMRHVKDKRWAEVEFLEDKPKVVKPKIQDMPEKVETNQIEAEIAKYRKQVNELESKAEVWENHAKFVDGKLIEAEQELKVYQAENNKFGNKIIELEKKVIKSHETIDNLVNENYVQERKIDFLRKEIETITKYNVEQLKLILKND